MDPNSPNNPLSPPSSTPEPSAAPDPSASMASALGMPPPIPAPISADPLAPSPIPSSLPVSDPLMSTPLSSTPPPAPLPSLSSEPTPPNSGITMDGGASLAATPITPAVPPAAAPTASAWDVPSPMPISPATPPPTSGQPDLSAMGLTQAPAPSDIPGSLPPIGNAESTSGNLSSQISQMMSAPLPSAPPQSFNDPQASVVPAAAAIPPPPIAPASPLPPAPTNPMDAVPTDLSHLTANLSATTSEDPTMTGNLNPTQPPVPQSESLVVPTPGDSNQIVTTGGGSKFPKVLLIIVGLLVLLAVGGASAYFILGIGKAPTTSAPIETPKDQTLTTPPGSTTPTLIPTPASSSGTFGSLSGSTPSGQATGSGTSALELLRQRQQNNQ